jgi:hypothetical protein
MTIKHFCSEQPVAVQEPMHWEILSITGQGTAMTRADVLSHFEELEYATLDRDGRIVAWESENDMITDGSGDDLRVAIAYPVYAQPNRW